jgi:hypothetical protein
MKLVIFALVCFISIVTSGQPNLIRWNDKEPLRWEDFSGKINDTSWFDAECFAEIRYNYKFNNLKNFQFDVFANFDKNTSWIKKEYKSEALLKHEQLHFDIAQLFSLRIKEMFENYKFTQNYLAEIRLLFNKRKLEYLSIQHQYDEETGHSLDKKKQSEWENFVTTELRKMKFKQQFALNGIINTKEGG